SRAGDHQDHRAGEVLEQLVVDARGAREVAAGEAHLAHRLDDRAGVELGDVDMLDRARQQLCLAGVVDLVVDQLFGSHFNTSLVPRTRESRYSRLGRKNSGIPALAEMAVASRPIVSQRSGA